MDMPSEHPNMHTRIDAAPFTGRTFYAPVRDAIAYLLSGIACALLVAYVAMLVAWIAAGGAS
jgi:hypothetical protein